MERKNPKPFLLSCAKKISEADSATSLRQLEEAVAVVNSLMKQLRRMVSVYGDSRQRLCAHMMAALQVRLSSWARLYNTNCKFVAERALLNNVCPYWKFGYMSSNSVIVEALGMEERIHIVDFQIEDAEQWGCIIKVVSVQYDGPRFPQVRISVVVSPDGDYTRELEIIRQKLEGIALSTRVSFVFESVRLEDVEIRDGEAVAVSLPYVMHKTPVDENVITANHRDHILKRVRSWSPKVVTLVEKESYTNTCSFYNRFLESLDYYTTVFEGIEAAAELMSSEERIKVESECIAIGSKRQETFCKWRQRFVAAGFLQMALSPWVGHGAREMLKNYSSNYWLAEGDGAICLGWKKRVVSTFSAWRCS